MLFRRRRRGSRRVPHYCTGNDETTSTAKPQTRRATLTIHTLSVAHFEPQTLLPSRGNQVPASLDRHQRLPRHRRQPHPPQPREPRRLEAQRLLEGVGELRQRVGGEGIVPDSVEGEARRRDVADDADEERRVEVGVGEGEELVDGEGGKVWGGGEEGGEDGGGEASSDEGEVEDVGELEGDEEGGKGEGGGRVASNVREDEGGERRLGGEEDGGEKFGLDGPVEGNVETRETERERDEGVCDDQRLGSGEL